MKKTLILILISLSLSGIFGIDNTTDTDNTPKIKNGWDYYVDREYQKSIDALLKEKKAFPDRINIYVILGWDYKKLGDYSMLEKISLEGLAVNSSDTRIIFNLAEAYYLQNKYKDTISTLEKYLSIKYNKSDPYLSTIYYYLGRTFYNLEYFQKADVSLTTAKYFEPTNPNILSSLATTKEKLKKYDEARKLFTDVLKIQPNNKNAVAGLKRLKDIKE